ncbi:hypothetical protein G6F68_015809 [Rhizopus microsporus]|nr:hypothetical protein G6F68_015809 [Rhizopus microsporus]
MAIAAARFVEGPAWTLYYLTFLGFTGAAFALGPARAATALPRAAAAATLAIPAATLLAWALSGWNAQVALSAPGPSPPGGVPAAARKTASGQAAESCGSSPATAVPKHRASLWLDYRFESAIKVGVGARYTGTNFGDQRTVVGTATYRW